MRSIALPSWIERALGLAPLPVPPHVFAVAEGELRYGAFLRQGGAFLFQEFHSLKLPPALRGAGPLGTPAPEIEALAAAVGQLADRVATPVREASLVLPDTWLRSLAIEVGDLPPDRQTRQEILRFKLRRLVPYRIDDLRIEAEEIPPLAGQEEPRRALVAFGHEGVLSGYEAAFARAGIRVGQVVGAAVALVAALGWRDRLPGLAAIVQVDEEGLVLVVARDGQPILVRQKSFGDDLAEGDRSLLTVRELRLTRSYLAERVPDVPLRTVLLAATGGADAAQWEGVLAEGLEREAARLRSAHLPVVGDAGEEATLAMAPMLGAATLEVA